MFESTEFTVKASEVLDNTSFDMEMIRAFTSDPLWSLYGYFTVDLDSTSHISNAGLDVIAALAYVISQTDGRLQFINTGWNPYTLLMNSNIGGQRIITWAEVYTKRDIDRLNSFTREMIADAQKYGLKPSEMMDMFNAGYEAFDKEWSFTQPHETDRLRRRHESALLYVQKEIEKRDTGLVAHLGYQYGASDITPLGRDSLEGVKKQS